MGILALAIDRHCKGSEREAVGASPVEGRHACHACSPPWTGSPIHGTEALTWKVSLSHLVTSGSKPTRPHI